MRPAESAPAPLPLARTRGCGGDCARCPCLAMDDADERTRPRSTALVRLADLWPFAALAATLA